MQNWLNFSFLCLGCFFLLNNTLRKEALTDREHVMHARANLIHRQSQKNEKNLLSYVVCTNYCFYSIIIFAISSKAEYEGKLKSVKHEKGFFVAYRPEEGNWSSYEKVKQLSGLSMDLGGAHFSGSNEDKTPKKLPKCSVAPNLPILLLNLNTHKLTPWQLK